jgi:hypothetical protein
MPGSPLAAINAGPSAVAAGTEVEELSDHSALESGTD